YKSLEARQSQLLKGAAQPVPAFLPETGSDRERLERLLCTCRDIRNLTFQNRKRALEWYRQLEDADLERLSPASLLALARLLRMAALSSRALHIYGILLTRHGDMREAALVALEAGRYAAAEQKEELARWFLAKATAEPLPKEDYEQ